MKPDTSNLLQQILEPQIVLADTLSDADIDKLANDYFLAKRQLKAFLAQEINFNAYLDTLNQIGVNLNDYALEIESLVE